MTPAQTALYWRGWASVARAHQWRGSGDALIAARQNCWVSPALNPVYQNVWLVADSLAAEEHRALTAGDMRHAFTEIAVGRQASSKTLTNAEFDRVLALFRLLADPHTLANLIAWQDQEAGERRRLLHAVNQSPAAYWQSIARDKFHGQTDLERLSLAQLRQLALTLRIRHSASRLAPRVPQPQNEVDPDLCPF